MARFSLEYDVEISNETKSFIYNKFNESMVSPVGCAVDSIQYCLEDIFKELKENDINIYDYNTLKELHIKGVDYIEIVW